MKKRFFELIYKMMGLKVIVWMIITILWVLKLIQIDGWQYLLFTAGVIGLRDLNKRMYQEPGSKPLDFFDSYK